MSNVKRVYVEKKAEFAVQAKELRHEIRSYLGIETVTGVRVLIRYDVENLSEDTFEKACNGIFAEPPVDVLYLERFMRKNFQRTREIWYFPSSTCRDSLIREQILLNSVCSLSKRTSLL